MFGFFHFCSICFMFRFLFSFFIGICLLCTSCTDRILSDHDLYSLAVQKTHLNDKLQIYDLVTLNRDDPLISYVGDKVAMATFHNVPEFYPAGSDVKLSIDVLWLVSYRELESVLSKNINCSSKRITQILGERPDSNYSHLSLVIIDPDKLIRPAYSQDPFVNKMSTSLSTDDTNFAHWFYSMKTQMNYPWTALGYTFDWGATDDYYGLSEFILRKNDSYHVVDTESISDFIRSGCKLQF